MAETVAQHQVSAISDPAAGAQILSSVVRGNDQTLRTGINDHDSDTGIHLQSSVLGSRPAFGTAGRKWLTTDGLRIYYDTGAAWSEVQYLPLAAGGTVAAAVTISAGSTTNALNVTTTGAITSTFRYDGSNRLDLSVSSAGVVTFEAVGSGAGFNFNDPVNVLQQAVVRTTTANQFEVGYDGSNHLRVDVSSAGAVTYNATGGSAGHTFSEAVTVTTGDLTALDGAVVGQRTSGTQLWAKYNGSNYMTIDVSSAGAVTYNAVGASAGHSFSDDVAVTGSLTVTRTASPQGRIAYDGSNYLDISVGATGAVTFDATGAGAAFTFSDAVTCSSTLSQSGSGALYSATVAGTAYKAFEISNTGGTLRFGVESSTGGLNFAGSGAYNAVIQSTGGRIFLSSTDVRIGSLAGTGTRAVVVDANGVLSAP